MFVAAKGFKKEDLFTVAEEIGEVVPQKATIHDLKELILKSKEYLKDPDFVTSILVSTVNDRKKWEEEKQKQLEYEKEKEIRQLEHEEKESARKHELELARLQAPLLGTGESSHSIGFASSRKQFNLPKLELRQFSGDIKDWLPFWGQFEQIHNDVDIAPENKFQYLIQATTAGSRAREVVESFPPTGANYVKAVESLKARFGKEDLLVEVYVRELLKLIVSVQKHERISLTSLYDKLETYLRALETLGVTTEKCASILFPMVESCFQEEFLKAWNRSASAIGSRDAKERLTNLMAFLKAETEGEERIHLAMAGFGLGTNERQLAFKKRGRDFINRKVPTAAALLSTDPRDMKKNCVFCSGKHKSTDCFSAQKMSLAERQSILREKQCCFACLLQGHTVRKCKSFLKCIACGKRHVPLMCDTLDARNREPDKGDKKYENSEINMSNITYGPKVFLQTLKLRLVSDRKEVIVRAVLDSGSQKTYIVKSLVEEMGYTPMRKETLIHSLFGGKKSEKCEHTCYRIRLRNLTNNLTCNLEALDQTSICDNITPVGSGSWLKELQKMNITLSDVGEKPRPVQVLLGADVVGKLMTGQRKVLTCGLVAIETLLGWTLTGKVPEIDLQPSNAMLVTSLFVKEMDISHLWRLDLLGIEDPIEKKTRFEIDRQTKEHFLETVTINDEGRYEVCLPWSDDTSPLPDNLSLAKKRLDYTTSKLLAVNLYKEYENVFSSWMEEGIIEEVPSSEISSYGNYLPHHAVIKPSSITTPIRPVFDASARLNNHPSLNECLQCGPNLIEFIPDLLLRFREKKFGVIADIRKAFLQISIRQEDRDFLRFLWWENLNEKKLKVFRHARVVFGVKCSPFLLASVIEYHIESCEGYDAAFKKRLKQSFYVDNVVTSVESEKELGKFMRDSKALMYKGGFDLRQWEYSGDCKENNKTETHVLGLLWNKELDTLKIDMDWVNKTNIEKISKRSMLSTIHKVFDPFGFACPVMLCPKLMLQSAWKTNISWDEEVTGVLRSEYLKWFQELKYLKDIQIPRVIFLNSNNLKNCVLHTFVDGSKDAYGAVTFLRIENKQDAKIVFLAAKSRVAPLRGATIPRMELLATVIGARLAYSIIEAMNWDDIERYYWTDSTTVLAWIQREENWSVFVRNRVREIRKLSSCQSWKHVPGDKNPADLPSRGCRAKHFNSLKWWEGPKWMKDNSDFYDVMDSSNYSFDEEEVSIEKLKSVTMLSSVEANRNTDWYYRYFSCYENIVRLVAWILRFKHNCFNAGSRIDGELTTAEFKKAEIKILIMIQRESFVSENDDRLKTLEAYKDDLGMIRLKTRLIYREDTQDFLNPVILPSKHEVVKRLILHAHVKNCHAGVQILLNILRERYWVLNGRKAVKQVVASCVICKRFSSKSVETVTPPLPEDRVRDAAVFQTTGIDMTGPLYLKENKKSWVLIFTCAVYRAVHLELVTSASTDAFLMAFRRFVARRGRCSVIYCDNGSNFVGASNCLKNLNWNQILKYGAVNAIEWKFNPPTAAWWGGWWERLIRILKDLLKRVLGRASLNYEEMTTVLADCESIINSRPLTYICENEAVKPISPSMFLQDEVEHGLPDIDAVERKSLCKRLKYRQTLKKNLRSRFRSEYLGSLVMRKNKTQRHQVISVGDIVLVGADNRKRIDWPIGRITKVIPGKDGNIRLVKVETSHQELLRPIQRIYPFEISSSDYPETKISSKVKDDESMKSKDNVPKDELRFTKSGRKIRIPERLTL